MKKAVALTLGVLLITYAVFKTLFGPSGFLRQFAIDDENTQLQIEIDSLQSKILKKNKEIDGLKKDLFVIEKKARTEMGMTKKGEVVFRFRDNNPSSTDSTELEAIPQDTTQ